MSLKHGASMFRKMGQVRRQPMFGMPPGILALTKLQGKLRLHNTTTTGHGNGSLAGWQRIAYTALAHGTECCSCGAAPPLPGLYMAPTSTQCDHESQAHQTVLSDTQLPSRQHGA